MKKSLSVFVAFVFVMAACFAFSGCATTSAITQDIDQFACKPTPAQSAAAQIGNIGITAALAALNVYDPTSVWVNALIGTGGAQAVFNAVLAGTCATQGAWAQAVSTLAQAQGQAATVTPASTPEGLQLKAAIAKAPQGNMIAYLHTFDASWPKK